MDLRDYALVLRKHWQLITACTLLAVGVAAIATFLTTPKYQASAQLFVSTSSSGNVGDLAQGSSFTQQRVKSYADIINSPRVTAAVIRELGLPETPRALGDQISASAPLDTVLIDVDVKDADPKRAARIANAVSRQFTLLVTELETPGGSKVSPVKVSVVKEATAPQAPISPRPKLNLALGLLVGLAIGVGAAVLRDVLDTSVKSAEDLQSAANLSPLGIIGFDSRAAKRPLIVQDDPQSSRAEAFRQLRTNLQFIDVDHSPRSLVITSSVQAEGKSTTAANLAISLAQAGVSVLLVEADLRRPRLAGYLGLEGAVGMTDVLIGQAVLEDVLQPWGHTGLLTVLPSGHVPPNPSELLGSGQMTTLLRDLEQRATLVLLDAPPLLPVTDAAVLSRVASGTVMVVRANKTKREQVARAMAALEAVDARVYGAILTMASTKGPDAYYYGGYSDAPESGWRGRRGAAQALGNRRLRKAANP